MPQLRTLARHLVTRYHVDNSPIQATVVDIQIAGSQWWPLSDRTAGPEPMTESCSLVILTDRRWPSLTLTDPLQPASPHGPPESRLLHPEKVFGNWGSNPCEHYTSRGG